MGMSNYVMSLEDEFFEMCAILAPECDSFNEYTDKMKLYKDFVRHMDAQEIEYAMADIWNEYWSYYQ